jgi:hypothetical protein
VYRIERSVPVCRVEGVTQQHLYTDTDLGIKI